MDRLPAWPLALQTPGLTGFGGAKPDSSKASAVGSARRPAARGLGTARSQPRVAPVFPCHLHMNEGKIGHQLLWSEMEMVFQMGWEGPRVPVRHTSNSWLAQESKMLIERAQSYSPTHCCSRAACWETSGCLIAVTGGERPPNCLRRSRSPFPRDSVPSWGKPLPARQVLLPRHSGTSPPRAGVKASLRGTGQSQEGGQGNKYRM